MANSASQAAAQDYPVGVFTSVFTGNEAFLADHIIQEKKILPGAAYLELCRAAIALSVSAGEREMITLSESVFIQPMIVTGKCAVEVRVYPGTGGEFGVEVSTGQGIHFQSKAHIPGRLEPQAPARLDLVALERLCPNPGPTKQQFYTNFKEKGINLGPSHRGIEEIRLGRDCALVKVSLPGSSKRGMDMDPGMLDSFIQSASVLARNLEEGIRLPFAVQKMQIYGPLTDRMYAHLVKNGQGVDYVIADENGEVRVVINGFIGRELDSQQDQMVYYKPAWREQAVDSDLDRAGITVIQGQTDYDELVKTVFRTAQQLVHDKADRHIIEVQLPADKPSWRGIVALLKTVSLEYPKISYRMKVDGKTLDLAYTAVDMAAAPAYTWPDHKTVLITGGLGGLGMLFARDIAAGSKGCTLILTGRSGLGPDKREFIKALEGLGAKVSYVQCDITQQDEVDALIAAHPGINGIIHGAGVINDNFIARKTPEEIDRVLAPKVRGLEYLDRASAKLKLDYFITLSSIAGTLGNAGQTDYAAANGYMDAYIHDRALLAGNGLRHGKSISINWPLWESEGMQVDEATKQNLLQVLKVKPMPAAFGLTAMKKILAGDHRQMVVLYGNKKAISGMFDKTGGGSAGQGVAAKQKKTANVEAGKLTREILQEVRIQTAQHLKRRPDQLDDTADWAEFGFDSILLSSFVNRINSQFNLNLMPTVFFEATNMQLFSQYLAENHSEPLAKKLSLAEAQPDPRVVREQTPPEQDQLKISTFAQGFRKNYRSAAAYRDKDIAIIGMSCRIAGARNPEEFWKVLDEERDMITEIPKDRWDWRDYPESRKWGSFIDGVTEFDPLFFGISPAEAMYINPEQRLIMQYVWECVENAGCGGDTLRGSNTGVFIGCGPSAYTSLLSSKPVEAYTATGEVPSVGPNRISYLMDWHGPSNPVETACSSALVAVHRAVEAIRAGHCDHAIAGGVNLLLTPHAYITFSKAGMLAEDGRCKTFSDKADGYVRGEGVGMLLLKPLKAAIQDGNVIHALIKGTAENHGGRTNSLTAPNPKSQTAVIKKAVRDAGIDFSRISYIECHGTGTELGDPVEIKGLKSAAADLLEANPVAHTCRLGSIKSNIGHLEFAAGVAGMIKVILQMKHRKIARSLHCEKLNPYIDLAGTPFMVAQHACEWEVPSSQTRVAGVSSFGFGGVNAHVILEEFQETVAANEEDTPRAAGRPQLLVFSARSEESLFDYVAQFPDFLKGLRNNPPALERIAYTLQTGRSEMQERLVFVANSLGEWAEQLDTFLQSKGKGYSRKIYRGTVRSNAADNLAIGDTQAGRDYIRRLVESDECEKLAELWVKGTKIDWQMLHNQPPHSPRSGEADI